MLRAIFVLGLVAVGGAYAVQGPFYALLFYLGNAYFRPEQWVWSELIAGLNLSFYSSIWLLLLTLVSRQRFVLNGRIGLLFLLLLHTLLSTIFSEYSTYSWPYWIAFLKIILVTYLLIVVTTDAVRFRLLILVIFLSLGLEQGKQGWVYLLSPP
jgi:hypothetical protein